MFYSPQATVIVATNYCTVLHCTVLYCTVLYCTVLYCTVLYCTVLYCTVLHCTALYCTALYCTALYCTVQARVTVATNYWANKAACDILFPVLKPGARVVNMSSSCGTVLYCVVLYFTVLYCTVLYCTVLYCTVLYCTVLYCTVLYCTVLYCTVHTGFLGHIGKSGDAAKAASLKSILASESLSREQLDKLMENFVETAEVSVTVCHSDTVTQ